jgi:hypothetical protein
MGYIPREQTADEAAWFKDHPAITAEEREKARAIGLELIRE